MATIKEVTWSSPEYHHYDKDIGWFWITGIITAIIFGVAIWQSNFLFAVFILIAGMLMMFWGNRSPEVLNFILNEKGLDMVGKRFYPFDDLDGYAILPTYEHEDLSHLVLKEKGRIKGYVKIIVANQKCEEIDNFLSKYLKVIEHDDSMTEHISRMLKF